jgi:hypothetical protein
MTQHVQACPRYPVAKLMAAGLLPAKYYEALEQNQLLHSCCRHPENHDIEAFKSNPDETVPDIYILHCTCGRKHTRFCAGKGDVRPFWEVR